MVCPRQNKKKNINEYVNKGKMMTGYEYYISY